MFGYNERKTEAIVRKFFEKQKNIIIEEQKSDNPVIQKILKGASKSGTGVGKPEFIITPLTIPGVLIIIECKALKDNHESLEKDQYAAYAVDGALCYASHLSNKFNVVAIGVSGQKSIKVSTYLWRKGAGKPVDLQINSLREMKEYIDCVHDDPDVRKTTNAELLASASELHNYMRDYAKLSETEKPLLVSGILIALMDRAFAVGFALKTPAKSLALFLYNTIEQNLKEADLPDIKVKNMMQPYSFISVHPQLTRGTALFEIIDMINEKVRPFLMHYGDVDVVGQFYGEFLSYTGGDKKGLGIVLTPKHICELFVELAEVNKDTVFLDTCCGTAGFMIAGMNKMTQLAGNNPEKRNHIREKQLIGVEQQPNMFALAASNMILRGDGKANLYMASSFDVVSEIESHHPTACCINPPYAQKGEGLKELNFIDNALKCLEPGSILVAVVPMSTTIKANLLKNELLEQHTLKAVMTLPPELFYPVGVATCCMVFKAHRPHPSGQKTWFGYWKDDGFVKIKKRGRVDINNVWPNIKKQWLDAYHSRLNIPEQSSYKMLSDDGVWCAEAYMDTAYDGMSNSVFEQEIRKYSSFLFMSQKREQVKSSSVSPTGPRLDISKWQWFPYDEVFNVIKGHYNNRPDSMDNGLPFISASEYNNGVTGSVIYKGTEVFPGKTITVSNDGSVGNAFYQEEKYTCSHSVNIIAIHPKYNRELDPYVAFFLIPIIQKEKHRFGYGFKWRLERMKKTMIKLPVNKKGYPDWNFMEMFVKSLKYSSNL